MQFLEYKRIRKCLKKWKENFFNHNSNSNLMHNFSAKLLSAGNLLPTSTWAAYSNKQNQNLQEHYSLVKNH